MNIHFSIWYDAEEHTPEKSGYYLAFRGFGMGGITSAGENEYEVLYYDAKDKHWDYESQGLFSDLCYWTDAKPNEWADKSPAKKSSKNPALDDAYNDVIKAFERYKIIKALV